jgi:hypothetical protein
LCQKKTKKKKLFRTFFFKFTESALITKMPSSIQQSLLELPTSES